MGPVSSISSISATSSIALSGMNAAQASLRSSAHNVANLGTESFHREESQQHTVASGGVTTSVTQATEPGNDMARDVVAQLSAKNSFLANLAVFRASSDMASTLFNVRA